MTLRQPWTHILEEGHPPWPRIIGLSFILHVLVFIGIWGLEHYSPRRVYNPSVISVSLVAQPKGQQPNSEPASVEKKEAPKIRKRIQRPVPRADRKLVSISPPELKIPERKKAPPREKPAPEPPRPTPDTKRTTQSAPAVAASPAGGGGVRMNPEEVRYLEVLKERIMENWRAYLPEEEGVLGEVQIRISRDGRIREFKFARGSGKSHIDASIVRAIKKVVLPPPPKSLAEQPLLLRFWPYGPES